MIGGKTQKELHSYVSCAGCAYGEDDYDLEKVKEVVRYCKDEGFAGAKWYVNSGPNDGLAGKKKLYGLFAAAREAAGDDFRIMCDCVCAWDLAYAKEMTRALADLDLFWIEEPLMPHQADSYAELKRCSGIPVAAGEHLMSRWDWKRYIDKDALDIYQPDVVFCGGISEVLKIMPLLGIFDKQAAFHHGINPNVTRHISAVYPPNLVILSEYLINLAPKDQYFCKYPAIPENGMYTLPDAPGVSLDIDESKVLNDWLIDLTV